MNGERRKVIYLFERPKWAARASARGQEEPEQAPKALSVQPDHGVPQGKMMSELYSATQVEKLLGVSVGRLRYWARCDLVVPSGRRGRLRFYTFQDLVGLRAAKGLMDAGLSTQRVRRAVSALRKQLPNHSRPLSELRVYCDGESVVVREGDRPFEAETGQLVLDFSVTDLRRHVVQIVKPGLGLDEASEADRAGRKGQQGAYDWYLEGCRDEASSDTAARAEEAYRRAIELDPRLACAYTNLGNLRYRAGAVEDARVLYLKALELEPDQPEAYYNLGYLSYEEGIMETAIELLRRAVGLDPTFGDAHFNLAMALIENGDAREAKLHFSTYLRLEPQGPWADVAKRHL